MKNSPFSILAAPVAIIAILVFAGGCSGGAEPAPAESAPAPNSAVSAEPEAAATETVAEPAAPGADAAVVLAPPEGSEPKSKAETIGGASTPETAAVTGPSIMGRVTFNGERPKRRPLETEADPKCAAMHADAPLVSDETIVSEDGGVQFAFAYIKNPPKADYPIPADAIRIDQKGCQYQPHVFGMRAGQNLDIHNSDDTTHNVRTFPTRGFDGKYINKTINFGQPGVGSRTQVFENPESAVKVKCDIHPWMQAYIFAMDHPFFATTDAAGHYALPTEGLPAGEYELVMWHEKWGEQTQSVTVGEDGAASADFVYSE